MGDFKLPHSQLLELRRWNGPSVFNGWKLVTKRDVLESLNVNREGVTDFAPQLGPMVGYAVTVEYCGSSKKASEENPDGYNKMFSYLASVPGPKIIFAKDLDAPNHFGAIFGEVTGSICRALGCVGLITDGWVRDVDEATYGNFKMMAKFLSGGTGYSCPLRFGNEIDILGAKVKPGMVVHADKYGFVTMLEEETEHLLESVQFSDSNECKHMIPAMRESQGKSVEELIELISTTNAKQFGEAAKFRQKILDL